MNINELFRLAFQQYQSGNLLDVVSICEKILKKNQNNIAVLHLLGVVYQQLQNYDAAIKYLKIALQLDRNSFEGFYNLGSAYEKKGELNEAIDCYRKVIKLNPKFVNAYMKLGNAFQHQGRLDEAITHYQKSIEIDPNFIGAYHNLGIAFKDIGKLDEAITYYQKAIQLNPNLAETFFNLGLALQEKGKLDEAIAYYQKAIQLNPNHADAYLNLGTLLHEQGKQNEAVTAYDKAVCLKPNNFIVHLSKCIVQLPIIYPDQQSIQICRNRYYEELIKIKNNFSLDTKQDVDGAANAVGIQRPFYLAYQGFNDRELQQIYGDLVCKIMGLRYPQFSERPSMPLLISEDPLRIGIVTGFFYFHTIWKLFKGWFQNLDQQRFSLYGYYTGKRKDKETEAARRCFSRFVEDIYSFEDLCEIIKKDNLHVLIYPEIGMDLMTVRLASLRLAPIQCTSWGHPDTSGLPTIDYYLSSDLMEPPEANDHYTEELIRLPNLSIYYTPIDSTSVDISRDTFNLRPKSILYLCPQSLYKYLPQYDEVYPRIAQQVGDCQFLFISYPRSDWVTEQFRLRVSHEFKRFNLKAEDYIVFLPRLNPEQYHAINCISDIFLDSICWSGGNTTFEALACDLPVVTLPGELMRGRHSSAILTMIGLTETVATTLDEYVSLAVKLGRDVEWRQYISDKISKNKHLAYRDKVCITALEDFLERVINQRLG